MTLYRYPEPPKQAWRPKLQRVKPQPDTDEPLTGQVQGKDASDLEEMLARAMSRDRRVDWYRFQVHYGGLPNTSTAIELDFLVKAGALYSIQVDGEWIHKSASTREHDRIQDARLDEILVPQGVRLTQRVKMTGRETQEDVNTIEERLF